MKPQGDDKGIHRERDIPDCAGRSGITKELAAFSAYKIAKTTILADFFGIAQVDWSYIRI